MIILWETFDERCLNMMDKCHVSIKKDNSIKLILRMSENITRRCIRSDKVILIKISKKLIMRISESSGRKYIGSPDQYTTLDLLQTLGF
jgi:hypothetical protein